MLRVAVGFSVLVAVMLSGCNPERGNADPAQKKPAETSFATERDDKETKPAAFDAKRAMAYLKSICDIGTRISGTEGMKKQQALIIKHFEGLKIKVQKQTFKAQQLTKRGQVEMTNLIFSWHPERKRRVILCSHYDTRPIADQEGDTRSWRKPFISANDGGSGVALLMELGNHMKDLKTEVGVDFVLFDGEEYIFDPNRDKYFFGSEYFATNYVKNRPKYRYVGAILLDMVGGKNASFPAEGFSARRAGALVQQLWKIADEQKCTAFKDQVGEAVQDDHLALLGAGIPTIDIIDFSYKHWHKLTDLPENCSGESLAQVSKVLTVWLQQVK
jgi:glutaminyl-peptide cyclotransferase